MSFESLLGSLQAGQTPVFPADADSLAYAQSLDEQDVLGHLRGEYVVPSKAMIHARALVGVPADVQAAVDKTDEKAIYFCGNSLGLQPRATRKFVEAQLETWGAIGVQGHFRALDGSPLAAWQDQAAVCATQMATLVGASAAEVAAMGTLTANLHLLLCSFYRPTATRYKIIAEWKPFPSDSYAIASQLAMHGHSVADALVEVQPDEGLYVSTERVLAAIDAHADSAALLLLPGVQYYTGQLFDMAAITAHAHARGLVVGWDLAHAFANVPLCLHDWGVDFAAWCTYKYGNAGPGAIAGVFVHERHSGRARLAGWYGCDKAVRFEMRKTFEAAPGAHGFQVSNPSAMDLASLAGALSVFAGTNMHALRAKSLVLTAYAEHLLNAARASDPGAFRIITPSDPAQRGAQLSVLLRAGTMPAVGRALEAAGIVLDQRKPDVIRIAPVPMYNTFAEVWAVVQVLKQV